MSLAKLVLLAADRYPDLEARLLRAHAIAVDGNLDRRAVDALAIEDDGGSLANLIITVHQRDSWDDARVIARHHADLEPRADSRTTATPVLTVPAGARLDLPASIAREFESTLTATKRIIRSAARRIVIIAAFAHPSAADIVGPEIAAATRRGVDVIFVTQGPQGTHDPQATLSRLAEIVVSNGDPKRLELRTADIGAERTMHAKIILVDDDTVLVGSANFTGNALAENFEAGFVVSGPPAASYARLLRSLEQDSHARRSRP